VLTIITIKNQFGYMEELSFIDKSFEYIEALAIKLNWELLTIKTAPTKESFNGCFTILC
jgi:hypothetical protein